MLILQLAMTFFVNMVNLPIPGLRFTEIITRECMRQSIGEDTWFHAKKVFDTAPLILTLLFVSAVQLPILRIIRKQIRAVGDARAVADQLNRKDIHIEQGSSNCCRVWMNGCVRINKQNKGIYTMPLYTTLLIVLWSLYLIQISYFPTSVLFDNIAFSVTWIPAFGYLMTCKEARYVCRNLCH